MSWYGHRALRKRCHNLVARPGSWICQARWDYSKLSTGQTCWVFLGFRQERKKESMPKGSNLEQFMRVHERIGSRVADGSGKSLMDGVKRKLRLTRDGGALQVLKSRMWQCRGHRPNKIIVSCINYYSFFSYLNISLVLPLLTHVLLSFKR